MYNAYRSGLAQGIRETASTYEKSIAEDKAQAAKANRKLLEVQLANVEKLQNENKSITTKYNDVLGQLRQRPTRDEYAKLQRSCVADGEAQTPIGGAGLPREDAEFLAGEAAAAALMQSERDYYYGELLTIYNTTKGNQ